MKKSIKYLICSIIFDITSIVGYWTNCPQDYILAFGGIVFGMLSWGELE